MDKVFIVFTEGDHYGSVVVDSIFLDREEAIKRLNTVPLPYSFTYFYVAEISVDVQPNPVSLYDVTIATRGRGLSK